jgi:hypothetical protein
MSGGVGELAQRPPACCGGGSNSGRPPSVSDCFDRGLRRRRRAPLPIEGQARADGNGLSAAFSIRLHDDDGAGTIGDAGFRADTCVTLIAYCERLAELATGRTLDAAARLSPTDLVAALAGVPPLKQDRATLAVAAFRTALAAARGGMFSQQEPGKAQP